MLSKVILSLFGLLTTIVLYATYEGTIFQDVVPHKYRSLKPPPWDDEPIAWRLEELKSAPMDYNELKQRSIQKTNTSNRFKSIRRVQAGYPRYSGGYHYGK